MIACQKMLSHTHPVPSAFLLDHDDIEDDSE